MSMRPSSVPLARPLSEALAGNEVLAALTRRVRESGARFEAIASCLPPALRDSVRPGPVDEEGWCLLVAHPAAAAKLRQLLPRLEATLAERGWPPRPVRLKVLPPSR